MILTPTSSQATLIRQATARVSAKSNVSDNWWNDDVKAYLSNNGKFDNYLQLSHLKIMCAQAEYLLAMKCLAMCINASVSSGSLTAMGSSQYVSVAHE